MNTEKITEGLSWTTVDQPLFYNSKYGIRFEIGNPKLTITTRKYFKSAMIRAASLYEDIFLKEDYLYLIVNSSCYKDEYLSEEWQVTPEIIDCIKSKDYMIETEVEQDSEDEDFLNFKTFIKIRSEDLNYMELLRRITSTDIGRSPNIRDDIFIVNEELNIIFLYYDDRGADIVAKDKELLKLIYERRNSWILDYDRESIIEMLQGARSRITETL